MTRYRIRLRVMPRGGMLDPQGQAVEHALAALGFSGVEHVHVGRSLELLVEADSEGAAREAAHQMCERLLANPVTEDFALEGVEAAR